MKFKKIDDNTIRCVLTETDMEENDIGLEDFFSSNREKIHGFLETIMDEARREIGYENDGSMLSMQLMPLPHNGLAITITVTGEDDLNDMIGSVKNILKDMRGQLSGEYDEDDDTDVDESVGSTYEITGSVCRIYVFDSLSDVENYCQAVSGRVKNLKTSLYKDGEGKYYMEISKGRASKAVYETACGQAQEYAMIKEASELFVNYMREHFERIISKRVIENIAL